MKRQPSGGLAQNPFPVWVRPGPLRKANNSEIYVFSSKMCMFHGFLAMTKKNTDFVGRDGLGNEKAVLPHHKYKFCWARAQGPLLAHGTRGPWDHGTTSTNRTFQSGGL